MKALIIFRHAKSDWSSGEAKDQDRPLSPRGKKAAKVMGRFLKRIGETPDSLVSSSAVRARKTAELAVKAGQWECKSRVTDRLYNCSETDVMRTIKAEADTTQTLMIVGHEPTCSETISRLVGEAKVGFSTAAMARLDLPIDRWRDADFGVAKLIWLVTPKLVKELRKG